MFCFLSWKEYKFKSKPGNSNESSPLSGFGVFFGPAKKDMKTIFVFFCMPLNIVE